jgi:hypothetical protein
VDSLELKVGYSSSVVAMVDMLIGTVTIEAGEFLMRGREIHVSRNFSHTGGKFHASAGGTTLFDGSSLQTVTMIKTSLGSSLYENYFNNFRVQSSSTVLATSDLIADGIFNISSGRLQLINSTITLTGGTQSGLGGSFNWDDSGGTFLSGSGAVVFDSPSGGNFQIRQTAGNTFANFTAMGAADLDALSDLTINGAFQLGGTGSSVRLNLRNTYTTIIHGSAQIGLHRLQEIQLLRWQGTHLNFKTVF